jgi:hypothetical protein
MVRDRNTVVASDDLDMVDYLDHLGMIVIFIDNLCRICNRFNRTFRTVSHDTQLLRIGLMPVYAGYRSLLVHSSIFLNK